MKQNTSAMVKNCAYRRMGEDILALTAGLGLGAGMMYLCDPPSPSILVFSRV